MTCWKIHENRISPNVQKARCNRNIDIQFPQDYYPDQHNYNYIVSLKTIGFGLNIRPNVESLEKKAIVYPLLNFFLLIDSPNLSLDQVSLCFSNVHPNQPATHSKYKISPQCSMLYVYLLSKMINLYRSNFARCQLCKEKTTKF